MDKKMQGMCEALRSLGVEPDKESLPDLASCEIVSTAEELLKLDEEVIQNAKPGKNQGEYT
jgi:serine O-acetyltransferase